MNTTKMFNNKSDLKSLGFTETLIPLVKKSQKINKNICQEIYQNSSNINNKYFYPSEFPKLTKIKKITLSNKKGGHKRKSRRAGISSFPV